MIAIHRLYQSAGKPALRKISDDIKECDDLPGTLSHEGVSAVLKGTSIPRWNNLAALAKILIRASHIPLDEEREIARILQLWSAVDGGGVITFEVERPSPPAATSPPAVAPEPSGEIPAMWNPATGELTLRVRPSFELLWKPDFEDGSDA